MPVIRIFYDEDLDATMREQRAAIQTGLEIMMREVLAADPAKCQIVMVPVLHASPAPVYVDLQFRANEHRTQDVVSDAMVRTAEALRLATSEAIRIRAFDIDQAMLHALDIDRSDS